MQKPRSTHTTRRGFIKSTIGVAAGLCMMDASGAGLNPPGSKRILSFYNLHTHERLRCCYWSNGHYDQSALDDIAFVLRDFRTGDVQPIAPRLLDVLVTLRAKLSSSREYQVISGYRSPKTNAMLRAHSTGVAKRSLHMLGQAIDVRLDGTRLSALRRAGAELKQGGVGYYPKSGFVHLDVGRPRAWAG